MSDVSALSQEYQTSADVARRLSAALLLLKRIHYRLPGAEAVTREELAATRRELEQLLRAIIARLEAPADPSGEERLPATLIARLTEQDRGSPGYLAQDLRSVADTLRQSFAQLATRHIEVLERLASTVDAQTSHVFRQMTRRRV